MVSVGWEGVNSSSELLCAKYMPMKLLFTTYAFAHSLRHLDKIQRPASREFNLVFDSGVPS